MKKLHFLAAALLFAGLAQHSFASTITSGQFNINGTIYVTDGSGTGVTIAGLGTESCALGTLCIFWQGTVTTANPVAPLQKANVSTPAPPNGDVPPGIAAANGAGIYDLTNPPNGVGSPGFADQLFMDFGTSGVTTQLMINFINPGIFLPTTCTAPPAPAALQTCTTPGSLFSFLNLTSASSVAAWNMSGETSGNPGFQSTWRGAFTSQFNIPFQTVLNNLNTNHFVSNTYSATITLDAPEPGALILIGGGLLGLGVLMRRRRAR